jgi:hypothetical protein
MKPRELVKEVVRVCGERYDRRDLMDVALKYPTDEDLTIKILDSPKDPARRQIQQLASGYGKWRTIKEELRRAFCRLVLAEMHKRGMEVDIFVA